MKIFPVNTFALTLGLQFSIWVLSAILGGANISLFSNISRGFFYTNTRGPLQIQFHPTNALPFNPELMMSHEIAFMSMVLASKKCQRTNER